jgi:hypothetical protein
MSTYAYLSLLKESHCFQWVLIVQSLTTFLVTPMEMLQAGSDLSLAN